MTISDQVILHAQQHKLSAAPRVFVVIPCYRVRSHIVDVLSRIGPEVDQVVCVDDACPEGTADWIQSEVQDPRVTILRHSQNRGVGGAVVTGYKHALSEGADIVVKIDGDGQMDPGLVGLFVGPLAAGDCDYTKGNRFYSPEDLASMPSFRLLGNAALSFMTKFSSGYWTIFDPTNGYTAIHSTALRAIPLGKLSERYFFESDVLFRLNIARAVVRDIPMRAHYGNEKSSLKIRQIIGPFLKGHFRNGLKRLGYSYFLRDFNVASLELVSGLSLVLFGLTFGITEWGRSLDTSTPASAGTVMLAALPFLVGVQMLLAALNFDVQSVPTYPLQRVSRRGTTTEAL